LPGEVVAVHGDVECAVDAGSGFDRVEDRPDPFRENDSARWDSEDDQI
jgi:hypothetical protein